VGLRPGGFLERDLARLLERHDRTTADTLIVPSEYVEVVIALR
jgi:hypothetical protein